MSSTAGPAHRVQSAVVEYGFPQGHLGHLTSSEDQALREFKALVIEKGLYKPQSETHEFGTHDDAMLLRFLRARRFNVHDALKQFKETEEWRTANQLDVLYETIDLKDYDETRALYPQWTGRRDKRGIPVYVFEVKHLNSKAMSAYEKSASKTKTQAKTDGQTPAKLLRLFALYENLVRFSLPLCTALTDRENPRTPITQSNNIVDISGVGLKQFWNLRAHMQDASTLATAHYPETLDRIFVIGAPSFFPTVWGWIKRWFDPITTSKIFILSHQDMNSTLRSFIDPANIPKKYGGELDFEFGDMPKLDPVINEQLHWEGEFKDFPEGPMFWVDRGDKIELKAVGYMDGKQRVQDVCTLPKKVQVHSLDDDQTPPKTAEGDEKPTSAGGLAVPVQTNGNSARTGSADSKDSSLEPQEPTDAEVAASEAPHEAQKVVQAGEIVPASRPEPVSFVTAHDGLGQLALNSKKDEGGAVTDSVPSSANGGPHKMAIANLLDPAVNEEGPTETAHAETDGNVTVEADDSHKATLKEKLLSKVTH